MLPVAIRYDDTSGFLRIMQQSRCSYFWATLNHIEIRYSSTLRRSRQAFDLSCGRRKRYAG